VFDEDEETTQSQGECEDCDNAEPTDDANVGDTESGE
jgi:hypothetical protein